MSTNHPYPYTDDPVEFQARVEAAMRKARRERAIAVNNILSGLWSKLRGGLRASPSRPAVVNHEHRSLAGCN